VKPANWSLALATTFLASLFFRLLRAQTTAVHKPQLQRSSSTLEGHWAGSLQAGEAVLHLVLHVSKAEDGSFKPPSIAWIKACTVLK